MTGQNIIDEVAARLGMKEITANTVPSTNQVLSWINSEAKLIALELGEHIPELHGLSVNTAVTDCARPLAVVVDMGELPTYRYLFYDNLSSAFSVSEQLEGQNSGATGVIVSITSWGTEGCLKLATVQGEFEDDEVINDESTGVADANGTLGDTWFTYDNEAAGPFDPSDTIIGVTSKATGTCVGVQDDVATGKLLLDNTFKEFQYGEQVTNTEGTPTTADISNTPVTVIAADYDNAVRITNNEYIAEIKRGQADKIGWTWHPIVQGLIRLTADKQWALEYVRVPGTYTTGTPSAPQMGPVWEALLVARVTAVGFLSNNEVQAAALILGKGGGQ